MPRPHPLNATPTSTQCRIHSYHIPPVQPITYATPTLQSPSKPKEDLPHPLADSADDEGVTVVLDSVGSTSPRSFQRGSHSPVPPPEPAMKVRSLPRSTPPIPAPRSGSSNNLTPPESPSFTHKAPPSPAPRNRHSGGSNASSTSAPGSLKTPSKECASENSGVVENGNSNGGTDSATPSIR
jgi:hypothetical protein